MAEHLSPRLPCELSSSIVNQKHGDHIRSGRVSTVDMLPNWWTLQMCRRRVQACHPQHAGRQRGGLLPFHFMGPPLLIWSN